jgi:Zn-dependent metalloprotease
MSCHCTIIPQKVLERLSKDKTLSAEARKGFADAAKLEAHWRKARVAQSKAAGIAAMESDAVLAAAPAITVYDCNHTQTLPGAPVPNPGSSADATAKRTFAETTSVAAFYKKVFGRNSVDNMGMTLQSSIHYGVKYNNAFWNGSQMTYGDGDGNIFVDFTLGNDVIAHELTHGVTQFTTHLAYSNEAGGLNESCSDVVGSMFRQWEANQTVAQADWLIGHNIMGPGAIAKGFTCLRDLANPAAAHCLSPQPTHFSQYHNGMDPHESSGIPNFAFYKAAQAVGGHSWEKVGQIWYATMIKYAPQPNMKMKTFANRTRKQAVMLYPGNLAVLGAVDAAWKAVGL